MFNDQIPSNMSLLFTESELAAAGFVECCNMKKTEQLLLSLENMPAPLFVNLQGEYYDVWHSVVRISINKNQPIWSYCVFVDRYGKEKMEYFHMLSKFCFEIPTNSRILYTKIINNTI